MATDNYFRQGLPLIESVSIDNNLSQNLSAVTVHWDEDDPMHPYNMNLWRKWLTVITLSMGSLCV